MDNRCFSVEENDDWTCLRKIIRTYLIFFSSLSNAHISRWFTHDRGKMFTLPLFLDEIPWASCLKVAYTPIFCSIFTYVCAIIKLAAV